jgi:hypothetical protein
MGFPDLQKSLPYRNNTRLPRGRCWKMADFLDQAITKARKDEKPKQQRRDHPRFVP